jgi:hypothetical protein
MRKENRSRFATLIFALPFLVEPATAFVGISQTRVGTTRPRVQVCHAESQSTTSNVLGGVANFETWFASVPGAECNPFVKHVDFASLRGLSYSMKSPLELRQAESLLKIPRSVVLESDFSANDWDANLAEQLWRECALGSSSKISGYCTLLTRDWAPRDSTDAPPSTAPDALRHWTDEQKSPLASNQAGQRLLDLQKQQEGQWKSKFSQVSGMTWEQFEWAMEVVHSRSFCGNFGIGSSLLPPAVSTAAPVVAAMAVYIYSVQFHGQEDIVLIGLAALGAIPAILNLVAQKPPVAVLLPLIDSANHREDADSSIEYTPLSDSFTLAAGSKCLVETDGKRQLFISYGKKTDSELLLNYGFLQGVPSDGEDSDISIHRRNLAEEFIALNK